MKKSKAIEIAAAILCAVCLWLYVVTVVTPNDDITISGIPVVFQGENELRNSHELIVSNKSVSVVEVKFHGSRADLKQLNANKNSITAVLDVAMFTSEREYSAGYEIVLPSALQDKELQVVDRSPRTVQFSVEKLAHRQVEVRGVFDGSLLPGFVQGDLVFDQDMVKVTGPSALVDQVSYAQVVVGGNDISQTFTADVSITLVGQNNETLHSNDLVTGTQVIRVTVPVFMEKELPLSVVPIYRGGSTAENTTVKIQPETLKVRGPESVLQPMTEISLGELDLALVSGGETVELPLVLPEGVTAAEEIASVSVTAEFVGIETLPVTVSNLLLENIPEGMTAELQETSLDVTLRGPSEDLMEVDDETLSATADLAEYSEAGSFTVPVQVHVPGETIGAVGEYTVTVVLKTDGEPVSE